MDAERGVQGGFFLSGREVDGAAAAKFEAEFGIFFKVAHKFRIEIETGERHPDEGGVGGGVDFAARREHAGSGPTGFVEGFAAIENGDLPALAREAPGSSESEDTGSGEGDIFHVSGRESVPRSGRRR